MTKVKLIKNLPNITENLTGEARMGGQAVWCKVTAIHYRPRYHLWNCQGLLPSYSPLYGVLSLHFKPSTEGWVSHFESLICAFWKLRDSGAGIRLISERLENGISISGKVQEHLSHRLRTSPIEVNLERDPRIKGQRRRAGWGQSEALTFEMG